MVKPNIIQSSIQAIRRLCSILKSQIFKHVLTDRRGKDISLSVQMQNCPIKRDNRKSAFSSSENFHENREGKHDFISEVDHGKRIIHENQPFTQRFSCLGNF
eukprot:Pompholyxophrys_punicea_v1_NODE_22_length_5431_cov_3.465402.p2 type:complete len:102 gc:universal NODE_22_length_5431_cov_3.465402:1764-1459(-)